VWRRLTGLVPLGAGFARRQGRLKEEEEKESGGQVIAENRARKSPPEGLESPAGTP